MFTLKKEIVDSMDEFLESQDTPDHYVESSKLIDEKVASFRASLPDDKQLEFNRMLNLIDDQHKSMVKWAYRAGYIKGFESENKMK